MSSSLAQVPSLYVYHAYRDLKLQITPEDHRAVCSLLKPLYTTYRPPKRTDKPHSYLPTNFMHAKSEELEVFGSLPHSPPFTPIFPRRIPICPAPRTAVTPKRKNNHRTTGDVSTRPDKGLSSIVDLPAFINADSEKIALDLHGNDNELEEKELYKENMVVVDGWRMSFSCGYL